MSTRLWTVPRVEVPTRRGLVVIALRRGRDVETTQRYPDYPPSAHEAEWVRRAFAPVRPTNDPAEVA
jgi:hypothetical protein